MQMISSTREGLYDANKAALDRPLAVMQLRAQGQNDMADALQKRTGSQKPSQRHCKSNLPQASKLGSWCGAAREAGLEKDIAISKLNAQAKIADSNWHNYLKKILMMSETEMREKGIRAARQVERIDKRILELQQKGGQRADDEIAKLEKVRNRQMEFVLDDQAKQAIEDIGGEKVKAGIFAKKHTWMHLTKEARTAGSRTKSTTSTKTKQSRILRSKSFSRGSTCTEKRSSRSRCQSCSTRRKTKKVKEAMDAGKDAIKTAGTGS